jgi:hypothetical protein
MIRLIYISTARGPVDEAAVERLLDVSRRNNRMVGLTGLLLYDGVRFLQALEGEAAALDATFGRIKADVRHRACVELGRAEVEARGFGAWDMAWRRLDGGRPDGGDETLADTVDRLVAQVPDPNTRALFTSFARIERRVA